jgi:hypothetical protein
MLPHLDRSSVYVRILGFLLLLAIAGCSSGELSRSEAKRKLSKTVDMCNPCFILVEPGDPLRSRLIQLGYVDPSSLQATPLGKQILGGNAVSFDPHAGPGTFIIGAFKKEIDEVTGIATSQKNSEVAEVKFKYRIAPVFDLLRDDPEIALTTLRRHRFFDLDQMGTIEKDGNKWIGFHTTGVAKFKKYDDGWRIEHANDYSHKADLDITPIGGYDLSLLRR